MAVAARREFEAALRRPERVLATLDDLPLGHRTPDGWAEIAAADLPAFLADHAFCEQQAALFALHLVGRYADDRELVERMTSLAAEEIAHLRRVASVLHARHGHPRRRRTNAYARALHERIAREEPMAKVDRLLVGALIEARSCERFTLLLRRLLGRDDEVAALLWDLGPAEKRHWEMFHALAARELPAVDLDERWRAWLAFEADTMRPLGSMPRVHG